MLREEMIEKLRNIRLTSYPTVVTFDMGMQFDVFSKDGAFTCLGEIASWPLWKLKRLSESKINDIQNKINNNSLTCEDFVDTELRTFVEEIVQNKKGDINLLLKDVCKYPFSSEDHYIYVYSDTEGWNDEVSFWGTLEEFEEDYLKRYRAMLTDWENFSDSELKSIIEEIEEHGEGLFFCEMEKD